MTRIELPYPAQLLAIWMIASEGSTRFDIDYVRVDFASGMLEATDGRAIVRQAFAPTEQAKDCGVFFFSRDDLKRVAKIIDRRPLRFVLAKDGDDWFAEGISTGGANVRIYIAAGVNVMWPNTEAIYGAEPSEKSVQFVLAQDVLRRLCSIASKTFEESLTFSIPLDGKSSFASLAIGDGEGDVRAMFMKKDGSEHPVKIVELGEPAVSNEDDTTPKDCTK